MRRCLHQSHAAYAFLTSGFKESDVLAIDGAGPSFTCIFIDRQGVITDLSPQLSIGGLWNRISQDIGFGYLGAGKSMGLAGFGQYNQDVYDLIQDYLTNPIHRLSETAKKIIRTVPKEDTAYTLQLATIDLIKKIVLPLKTSDNICVSGGVAYNGYMNEELTKHYVNVHVPPAVGDEGQAIGTYMHADYMLNQHIHVPNVYAGYEHNVNETIFDGLAYNKKPFGDIAKEVAASIADGKIVGWYQGKSESGNRALGNRSILADPRNPDIKNIINRTIKKREDFRPFAPSVLEDYYQEYFDTNQPSPFMSRIVPVKSDKIPGVTHVDNTARIQTVDRNFNQRFYDVINEFYTITGIPMLLNTSFNCQEPVVETPEQAVNTFLNTELDILVINDYIVRKLR
jgi:carbamoyltransferase